MSRFALLLALTALVPSCAPRLDITPVAEHREAPPSMALERFDRLGRPLQGVTVLSRRLAVDVSSLGGGMHAGNIVRARMAAVRLKIDAGSFAVRAGNAGNLVAVLAAPEPNVTLHEYFRLVDETLVHQWYEGAALARLADVAWADPWLRTGTEERRFARIIRRARWYAWLSTRSASRAAAWRRQFPQAFRYTLPSRDAGVRRLLKGTR